MANINIGLSMDAIQSNLDLTESNIKVLDYHHKVEITITNDTVTPITQDGALLFVNPSTSFNSNNVAVFNGELYDGVAKLMDLNFNGNTPTSTISVYAGMSYKSINWTTPTECKLYFVPFKHKLLTYGGDENIDYVQEYNTALGDSITRLEALINNDESGSESGA